jgi:excisionase family DNA binding protein
MNVTDLPGMLTVEEAAQLLRISRGAAYALAKKGTLPGVLRLGRTLRVSRAVIERVLAGEAPAMVRSRHQARVSSGR